MNMALTPSPLHPPSSNASFDAGLSPPSKAYRSNASGLRSAEHVLAVAGSGMAVLALADAQMRDALQRKAFDNFLRQSQAHNGLVADTSRAGAPARMAVVGFALSTYPVAVERGWMARDIAVQRRLTT
jgi:hypothetical protein